MITRQKEMLRCEPHAAFLIQGCFISTLSAVNVEKEKNLWWTPFQINIKTDPAFVEEPALHTFLISSAQVGSRLSCWVKASADAEVKEERAPWMQRSNEGGSDRNLPRLNLYPPPVAFQRERTWLQ